MTGAPSKASEIAYQKVKYRILNLDIKPGAFLSETTLSKELEISRTPIREALKKLEHEGLVVSINGRKRVNILTVDEINEIFDLKQAIEGRIARLAAMRGNAEQAKQLRKIVNNIKRFGKKNLSDPSKQRELLMEWLEMDRQFHGTLFKMANNNRAEQVIKNLNLQWYQLKLGVSATEGRMKINVIEHQEIGQAVLDNQPDKAEQLVYKHLEKLQQTLVHLMRAFQFY